MGKSRPRRSAAPPATEPSRDTTRQLLLRGLGAIHLIAFVSLWMQAPGLTGADGIVPLDATFAHAREVAAASGRTGWVALDAFLLLPTIGWWLPLSTRLICALGVVAAGLVVAGRHIGPALLTAALLYLSCHSTTAPFLNFQWDILLIEASFAALLIAPWRRHASTSPPDWAWWPLRWLLFRVVFLSGVVKLQSGDPTWRDLTALAWHYESQPIPNPVAWYAHQLPELIQRACTLGNHAVELVLVFGLLGPRALRGPAAAAVLALMAGLAFTGNYGFFQLLTALLCLAVLDDAHLRRPATASPAAPATPTTKGVTGAAAALLILLSTTQALERHSPLRVPEPLPTISKVVAPFRITNPYGLFANMTTTRPTVVIEVRWDNGPWTPLRWRYQPTDPADRPPQVAPHMPRLDWMLWFAGYQGCKPWVQRLQQRVLEGSPSVRALVGDMRLHGRPPTAARTTLRHLRFTHAGSPEAQQGDWWRVEGTSAHCPAQRLAP